MEQQTLQLTTEVKCPKCGLDVLETGFTVEAPVVESYMRFPQGVLRIASAPGTPQKACCLHCGAPLPVVAADLMRAA